MDGSSIDKLEARGVNRKAKRAKKLAYDKSENETDGRLALAQFRDEFERMDPVLAMIRVGVFKPGWRPESRRSKTR